MVFHKRLSDSKSPQDSRILPSIMRDITNGLVLLYFDLGPSKMPFKVMHRKEVTHSNGS